METKTSRSSRAELIGFIASAAILALLPGCPRCADDLAPAAGTVGPGPAGEACPEGCALLDGPCQRGRCDPARRECVAEPAPDGTPCAGDEELGVAGPDRYPLLEWNEPVGACRAISTADGAVALLLRDPAGLHLLRLSSDLRPVAPATRIASHRAWILDGVHRDGRIAVAWMAEGGGGGPPENEQRVAILGCH